jgi:CheY-like chemotaxis protein
MIAKAAPWLGAAKRIRMARILIIDNNDSVRTLLVHLLRFEGHQVEQARDGGLALARFADRSFDLVLMDVHLPRIDGLEICRKLRQESQIPIVFFSVSQDPSLQQQAMRCGASAFLNKPMGFKRLLAWLRSTTRLVDFSLFA